MSEASKETPRAPRCAHGKHILLDPPCSECVQEVDAFRGLCQTPERRIEKRRELRIQWACVSGHEHKTEIEAARCIAEHFADSETTDYSDAIDKLRPHISRASDGTFVIDVETASTLNIDPIVLSDLLRSVGHTNEMIRRGVIKPEDVEDA